MATAVAGRSVIHPESFAWSCSSSSNSGLEIQKWQFDSRRLLGGGSMRFLLRAAAGTHLKIGAGRPGGGTAQAYKKKPVIPVDDPFNYGEDEDMEDGELMSTGKQSVELPRPPNSRTNEYGFLDFPRGYNVEIASLGLYVRNDVRRCLCWVAGGVYENLLFFPAIQLLKNRYPGVRIDVVAGERGKQVYEMNKYINKGHVFDTDAEWTVPRALTEFLGVLRNQYYDMILSTKYAGFKHCATMFMVGGRTRRISYVPKYHSEWVSNRFLSEAIEAPREILADGGYNMYEEILDYVAQPGKGVPQEPIPPLQVGVSKRVRAVVREKMNEAGLSEGKFVVIHGIESDSAASMTSLGDTDSLLPLQCWAQLVKQLQDSSGVKVAVVVPHQRERKKVFEACGQDVSVVFITTPGQATQLVSQGRCQPDVRTLLAAAKAHSQPDGTTLTSQLGSLIRDSAGVISTNTAAMLMAVALKKPSVALFGSAEKASLFVPPQAEKIKVVVSKTGKLAGVDADEATSAWRFVFQGQLVLSS